MKKLFKGLLTLSIVGLSALGVTSCSKKNNTSGVTSSSEKSNTSEGKSASTIAILKYGTHVSLDEIETGIIDEIKEKTGDKYTITTKDCSFDSSLIDANITAVKDLDLACVVAIATPVAVACANNFTDIPVVFAAVSDPEAAGVLDTNVTGTSDATQLSSLVDLAKQVDSSVSKIGYIYTETEANSISNLGKLKSIAKDEGLTLVSKSISKAADITSTFDAVKDEGIDALIVTDDNNVASGMDNLSSLCASNNIPMYCAADSEVKDGGMMGYSISYKALAKYTADQVVEIVDEKKPVSEVPVKYFNQESDLALYYNSDFLKAATGISIPQEILSKATDLASAE